MVSLRNETIAVEVKPCLSVRKIGIYLTYFAIKFLSINPFAR